MTVDLDSTIRDCYKRRRQLTAMQRNSCLTTREARELVLLEACINKLELAEEHIRMLGSVIQSAEKAVEGSESMRGINVACLGNAIKHLRQWEGKATK